MIYKNIGGQHEQDGKLYPNGATIDTSLDLEKLFPDKFEKVHPSDLGKALKVNPDAVKTVQKAAEEELEAPPVEDDEIKGQEDSYGKDVTDKFKDCDVLDCRVFSQKNSSRPTSRIYYVTDMDGTTLWSDEAFKSKKKTQAFLNEYLEDE